MLRTELMKKVLLAAVAIGIYGTNTSQAAYEFGINKDGSTLSWEGKIATHNRIPEITTEITVIDAGSASLRGVYGGGDAGDSVMYTTLSLNAGDKVSFDWYLSNNSQNIPGGQGDAWVGDTTFHFKTVNDFGNDPKVTQRFYVNNVGDYRNSYDNGVDGWHDNGADLNNGVHVEFIFGQTNYTMTVTSLVDPSFTSGGTRDYLDGLTVDDITSFRLGIWDSEQTVTLSNFTVVPEPASMLILATGGLLFTRKRHN